MAKVSQDDLIDLSVRANKLAMDLTLVSNKMNRGEVEELILPEDALRVLNNLGMWCNQLAVTILDVAVMSKRTKKE